MDIPSGGIIGLLRVLFKPIADFLEMLLYYRAYEVSTIYHNHREAFGVRPRELIDGVDFKILWKPYYLRKKLVTPMIWLRAKNGSSFSKIALTVTASNKKIKFQDHITLFDVNDIPMQAALPSIPFRLLKIEGSTVFTPYDNIKVEVKELYDNQGNEIRVHPQSEKSVCPFDRLEITMGLEKGDIEKWGEIFNLEFIEMMIKEDRMKLIGPMIGRLKPVYLLRKRLFNVNWVVRMIFWSKNVVFAKQLAAELVKYLEEHEQQKKWEQKNLRQDVA